MYCVDLFVVGGASGVVVIGKAFCCVSIVDTGRSWFVELTVCHGANCPCCGGGIVITLFCIDVLGIERFLYIG